MRFFEDKGLAVCGLPCALCSEEACPGCAQRGCKDADSCSVLRCAAGKGLDGCYACDEFPCNEKMLQGIRNRAFNQYARQFGRPALLERLKANFESGIVYHKPGGLKGDYDVPETEDDIMRLIQFGRDDPYRDCPTFQSEHFTIRLLTNEDADDLIDCYGDPEARRFLNADNCIPFNFSPENVRSMVKGWIERDYAGAWYIRFAIVDKQTQKAVGTLETYDWKNQQKDRTTGILRVDIASRFEKAQYLSELFQTGSRIFFDVYHSHAVITKAIPEATERIAALRAEGWRDAEEREHYFILQR